jgi:hypothetical protein
MKSSETFLDFASFPTVHELEFTRRFGIEQIYTPADQLHRA